MRKLLFIGFVVMSFAGCADKMHGGYKIGDILNKNLLHSVFSDKAKESADSLKAPSNNHFNFFLKEGFAKKFGL